MEAAVLSSASIKGQLNLLQSGAFSDFKIICKSDEFKVHRAIICPNLTYFSKVCADGFAFKEGSEAKVVMNEDDPTIVSRVLLYQYTKGYDAGEVPKIGTTKAVREAETIFNKAGAFNQNAASVAKAALTRNSHRTKTGLELTIDQAQQHLAVHAEVYACADRLGIEELKEYACNYFVYIAGNDEMKLCNQPFYGKLLTFVYENTMMEMTEKEGSKPRKPNRLTDLVRTTSGLRYAATMCAVQNLTLVRAASEIENAIKEHEPMAWAVAQVLIDTRAELERTRLILYHKRRCVDNANRKLNQRGSEQVVYAKKVVGKLQSNLDRLRKCTGCKKELKIGTITIDGESSLTGSVKVVVTCRGCHVRLPIEVGTT